MDSLCSRPPARPGHLFPLHVHVPSPLPPFPPHVYMLAIVRGSPHRYCAPSHLLLLFPLHAHIPDCAHLCPTYSLSSKVQPGGCSLSPSPSVRTEGARWNLFATFRAICGLPRELASISSDLEIRQKMLVWFGPQAGSCKRQRWVTACKHFRGTTDPRMPRRKGLQAEEYDRISKATGRIQGETLGETNM